MTNIKVYLRTTLSDLSVEIKESFSLVKKRLLDNQSFIELTQAVGNKVIYNKLIIGKITCMESVGEFKKRDYHKLKK